jgi:DNA (cytosine-5)-methyltransferase 1
MRIYYNELDRYCVQWLKNLIATGLLPDGDVDGRSITEVQPHELSGYDQCHFFTGLGGWPRALQLADWRGPVWTGSCPCQPFSSAGQQKGFADDRHLWPQWFRLIRECRPPVVFGEQVASAKLWLDAVLADLEGELYGCGATVLPAAGVGAPHTRNRIWFVAYADGFGLWDQPRRGCGPDWQGAPLAADHGQTGVVADANRQGEHAVPVYAEVAGTPQLVADAAQQHVDRGGDPRSRGRAQPPDRSSDVADAECVVGQPRRSGHPEQGPRGRDFGGGAVGPDVADASSARCRQGQRGESWALRDQARRSEPQRRGDDVADACGEGLEGSLAGGLQQEITLPAGDSWWWTEPDVGRVAHGVPARVGKLRALGNAIVPQVAAEFIKAARLTDG